MSTANVAVLVNLGNGVRLGMVGTVPKPRATEGADILWMSFHRSDSSAELLDGMAKHLPVEYVFTHGRFSFWPIRQRISNQFCFMTLKGEALPPIADCPPWPTRRARSAPWLNGHPERDELWRAWALSLQILEEQWNPKPKVPILTAYERLLGEP